MNQHELIAYSMDFCSFLIKSEASKDINRIILFGSVARGDFDSESDIDIFIDTDKGENVEEAAKRTLKSFEMSETKEKWKLKGLKNNISLQVGRIEEWKLYRSIVASGIMLYGKFEEMPKGAKYYSMLALDFRKMDRNKKIRIWRALYGYKQKIGKKIFVSKGLLEELNGMKIERSVIAIPAENKGGILDFFKIHKVKYRIFEVWTDSF